MSKEPPRGESLQSFDPQWYRDLGDVASAIGTESFHRKLLSLFGSCIENSCSWIMRYSHVAPPDVLFTVNVPDEIVQFYNKKCTKIDPFSRHWRTHQQAGILTLAQIRDTNAESVIYTKIFCRAAKVADEIGMFFPAVGHCCFGLFLERAAGKFTEEDVALAELIFPALEGCHRSHLGQLFGNLRHTDVPATADFGDRPTLIRDRHGVPVYANAPWKQALSTDETIEPLLNKIGPSEETQTFMSRDFVLKSRVFDREFSLAPGGRIFSLETHPSSSDDSELGYEAAAEILLALTPRERDILTLIMQSQGTGQIAQKLEIGKGTVKNCKLRIYRKVGVSTERDLVRKFYPFFPS